MQKLFAIIGFTLIFFLGIYLYWSNRAEPSSLPEPQTVMVSLPQKSSFAYSEYTKEAFDQAKDKKRVLYFHAVWCPVCKQIDKELAASTAKLPPNTVVFKTDYDKETALKQQYGITYQHTFVYMDSEGKALKKWNGGGVTEIINNTE